MSLYSQYKTNTEYEKKGVTFQFGDYRIVLARAGGANARYQKVLTAKMKPYRRAIQNGSLDNETEIRIMRETFIDCCIIDWLTKSVAEDGTVDWKKGIEGPDGTLKPVNKENLLAVYEDLPDLFIEHQNLANDMNNYRAEEIEADVGNS